MRCHRWVLSIGNVTPHITTYGARPQPADHRTHSPDGIVLLAEGLGEDRHGGSRRLGGLLANLVRLSGDRRDGRHPLGFAV